MKKLIIGLAVLGLFVAGNASASCGLGYAPRSRFPLEVKKQYTPPFFVAGEVDGDGKREGRSDSYAMYLHDICVEDKKQ